MYQKLLKKNKKKKVIEGRVKLTFKLYFEKYQFNTESDYNLFVIFYIKCYLISNRQSDLNFNVR